MKIDTKKIKKEALDLILKLNEKPEIKPKHRPTWSFSESKYGTNFRVYSDITPHICTIHYGTASGFPSEAESKANAQLITAAPELLDALRRATPWLGKMIADGGHLKSVLPNDCLIVLQLANSAIAKAEGRE